MDDESAGMMERQPESYSELLPDDSKALLTVVSSDDCSDMMLVVWKAAMLEQMKVAELLV
jgi:hypothetical protein